MITPARVFVAVRDMLSKKTGVKYSLDAEDLRDRTAAITAQKTAEVQRENGVRYSLMEFEDGTRYVDVDQDQNRFIGHDVSEYPSIAKSIIREKFANRVVGLDNRTYVNMNSAGEYTNSRVTVTGEKYLAKMRASAELDNLVDAGRNFRNEPDGRDGHYHKNVTGGYDYFDVIFKVGDKYYEGTINIENNKYGKRLKDIKKIKDVTQEILSSYGENPKSQFLRTSSMNNIADTQKKSNTSTRNSLDADSLLAKREYEQKTDAVYNELVQARQDLADAQKKRASVLESKEYNDVVEAVGKAKGDDLDTAIKQYVDFMNRSGANEAQRTIDKLEKKVEQLKTQFDKLTGEKAASDREKAIAKSGLSEQDFDRKQAEKEFGYTPYFYDAGYMLPNGKLLNFSG